MTLRDTKESPDMINRFDAWIGWMIGGALRLLRIELKESTVASLVQFVKFCIVGFSNTVVSYAINIAVLFLLKPYDLTWDYVAGNVISYTLSILWSYYWNNKCVFVLEKGQKRNTWSTLLKTFIAYGFTGYILNNILSYIWIDALGISKLIAPLINLIINIPLNFAINRFWAFKSTEKKDK